MPDGTLFYPSQLGVEQFNTIFQRLGWRKNKIAWFLAQYTNTRVYFNNATRKGTGEPYRNHLKAALYNLLKLGVHDPVTVIACLQHDSVEDVIRLNKNTGIIGDREDCTVSFLEFFASMFNSKKAAKIVLSVTKPDRQKDKSAMTPEEIRAYNIEAYSQVLNLHPDVRVQAAQVKVADRISNLQTMQGYSEQAIAQKVAETITYITNIAVIAGQQFFDALYKAITQAVDGLNPKFLELQSKPYNYNLQSV